MAGLLGSLGCSNQGTPTTPAVGATSADLKQVVQTKLASDPQLARIDVAVDGDHNQVTLSGSAPSEQARSEAVEMAKAAQANVTVVDSIDVQTEGVARSEFTEDLAREARQKAKAVGDRIGQSLDEAWIYTKIEAKLASNPATPALKIHVDVFKSVVTLRGEVPSISAKQEAERIAKETDGVKLVHNDLEVTGA
ncbi:MAG TPA: BON domain-containing protein [Bryobacteraceae bacterium]|nr:BON domain-containing protein [Bryobacteraceae bacterium]